MAPSGLHAGPLLMLTSSRTVVTLPSSSRRYSEPPDSRSSYAMDPAQNRPAASQAASFIRCVSGTSAASSVSVPPAARCTRPWPAARTRPPDAAGAKAPSGRPTSTTAGASRASSGARCRRPAMRSTQDSCAPSQRSPSPNTYRLVVAGSAAYVLMPARCHGCAEPGLQRLLLRGLRRRLTATTRRSPAAAASGVRRDLEETPRSRPHGRQLAGHRPDRSRAREGRVLGRSRVALDVEDPHLPAGARGVRLAAVVAARPAESRRGTAARTARPVARQQLEPARRRGAAPRARPARQRSVRTTASSRRRRRGPCGR